MGEENNNGILFYSDNIVRSVSDTSYSRYELSYPDIVHVPNVSGELALPDVIDKVLKKTIDGLTNIQIDSYQKNVSYGFSSNYKYTINLILTFSNFGIKTKEQLSEMINSSFSVMYPDKENFRFNVLQLTSDVRNYDKEFFGFFKKK